MAQAHLQTSRKRSIDVPAPVYGMAAGTTVLTLDGALPVEFLTPGDRILTRSGLRRLKAIEITRMTHARMARVCPDALALSEADTTVWMLASQPMLVRDWRAVALFGKDQALVAVSRLTDGEYIRCEVVAEARIFTLKLDSEGVIYAGGLELGCEAETVEA